MPRGSRRYLQTRLIRWAIGLVGAGLVVAGAYGVYRFYSPKGSSLAIRQPVFTKPAVDPAKPSEKQTQAYTVPADHPRQLIIDSLGINALVLPMGTQKDGALEAPKTAWEVGWYTQSALPGSDSGALLIDGHVNDALNQPGVFYRLASLQTGDEIKIQRGDMRTITYHVRQVEQLPTSRVDMTRLLTSVDPEREGLNLITCGGTYNKARQTYNDRVLVYAVRDQL